MKSERVAIFANGQRREIQSPCSVADFLGTCSLKSTQVVVEYNGRTLLREELAVTELKEGDRVEVIVPVAGG